jgi:hypothetical protein
MDYEGTRLLGRIYSHQNYIYLRSLTHTALHSASATFVFGHNPRTRDYTHVGAAEMLAGLSQAAYCMVARYRPELLVADLIERAYFRAVNVTFSKMLAPETEASLTLEMTLGVDGLPRFNFDGFIKGCVECGLAEVHAGEPVALRQGDGLSPSVRKTLGTFYNNGSEITLERFETKATHQFHTKSYFRGDPRSHVWNYATTTQLIIGLSQVAFAVVGELNQADENPLGWECQEFLDSMGDQTLVKLSYVRPRGTDFALTLDNSLASSKTLKGCKFIRLALGGDLHGTMDSMLSPRVPVKTVKQAS